MTFKQDLPTTLGAAGAAASPVWLPSLHDYSVWAAEWAPILGTLWLIMKILEWSFTRYHHHKFRKELKSQLRKAHEQSLKETPE